MAITIIEPEDVVKVWSDAEPQLARALCIVGEHTTHDILVQLLTTEARLWRIHNAWCVTEVIEYPRLKVAMGSHLGGTMDPMSLRDALPKWRQWAKEHGCKELRIVGRRGWRRVFPEFREDTVLSMSVE